MNHPFLRPLADCARRGPSGGRRARAACMGAALLLSSITAAAEQRSIEDAVQVLIDTTKSALLFERVGSQVDSAFEQAVQGMNVGPEQQAIVEKHYDRFMTVKREQLDWANWRTQITKRYLAVFSEAEIRGLVAFYESDLGRKLLQNERAITQASLELAESDMQAMLPRLRSILVELSSELETAR